MDMLIEQREDKSLPTVSVVVMNGELLDNCTAFPDNEEGNQKAEELFKKVVKTILMSTLLKEFRPKIADEELEYHLEEGYFSPDGSESAVFITHT